MTNSSVIRFWLRDLMAVVLFLLPLTVAFPVHPVDGPKLWSIVPVPSRVARRKQQQAGWSSTLLYHSGGRGDNIISSPTTSTSHSGITTTRYDDKAASTTPRRDSKPQKIRVVPNMENKESVSQRRRSQRKKIPLIPLSPNPRLFVSSSPLLTPKECEIVSEWCRGVERRGESIEGLLRNHEYHIKNPYSEEPNHVQNRKGIQVMKKLQRLVHHSVLGMGGGPRKDSNLPVGDEYVVPRFLHYQSTEGRTRQECNDNWNGVTVDQLIPDGLHVDTNNNKHFRHWTILVYLDSTESPSIGGATTFPLAERYPNHSSPRKSWNASCPLPLVGPLGTPGSNEESSLAASIATKAATDLIYRENVQHTRIVQDNRHVMELGKSMEDAALRLYQEDAHAWLQGGHGQSTSSHQSVDSTASNQGIRVMPRQGHVCLFSGVNQDGYPNPFSFHAGEAILCRGGSKNVLTFFYEVPTSLFSSRAEFGEQVRQREEAFLKFHDLS